MAITMPMCVSVWVGLFMFVACIFISWFSGSVRGLSVSWCLAEIYGNGNHGLGKRTLPDTS